MTYTGFQYEIVRDYLEFILRMIAKFDRFKKFKSTRTNRDRRLGLQRDVATGVINPGVTVLPSHRDCFMCGHATTQRFMEFQEYKKCKQIPPS